MKMHALICALAFGAALFPAAAMADDPNDPTMRDPAARARDHAIIRQLNLHELAYVQQRDAQYAVGWREWREAQGGNAGSSNAGYASERREYEARSAGQEREHDRATSDYAQERARYEREMAQWRHAVTACRAGDYAACD